jgi:hypothetical protein
MQHLQKISPAFFPITIKIKLTHQIVLVTLTWTWTRHLTHKAQ